MTTAAFGESLATMLLTRYTRQGYLFRPLLIGGNWPTVDIYAEVISEPGVLCFLQVKATELAVGKRKALLPVAVSQQGLNRLAQFHAPSYVVGVAVDTQNSLASKAYLAAVRGEYATGWRGLPTKYELNEENLIRLRDDVVTFWKQTNTLVVKAHQASTFLL